MPVQDASYMLRDGSSALSASEQSGAGVFVGKGPIHGMICQMYVPSYAGTTPTLDCKLQEATTSGGSFTDVPGGAFAQVGEATGTYQIHVHWTKPYVRAYITLTGSGANYGATTVGLTPGEIPTT